MIQFLFRKSESTPATTVPLNHARNKNASKQWTNKLASLVDEASNMQAEKIQDPENLGLHQPPRSYQTSLRLEGPYFTAADPASYNTVICLVAGTGISGAIAIAAAFSAQFSRPEQCTPPLTEQSETAIEDHRIEQQQRYDTEKVKEISWRRCVIIWSVRESDCITLPFFQDTPGLEVRSHLTGPGHQRLDQQRAIENVIQADPRAKTWVYLSGPNAFIEAGEKACRASGVDFFGARWA